MSAGRQSERWALLGNAVTVPVAKWLGEQLAHPYRHKYCTGARDRRMDCATNTNAGERASAADAGGAGVDAPAQIKGRVRVSSGGGGGVGGSSGAAGGRCAGEVPWTWDEEDFVDDGDMFEYRVLTQTGVQPGWPPSCNG